MTEGTTHGVVFAIVVGLLDGIAADYSGISVVPVGFVGCEVDLGIVREGGEDEEDESRNYLFEELLLTARWLVEKWEGK